MSRTNASEYALKIGSPEAYKHACFSHCTVSVISVKVQNFKGLEFQSKGSLFRQIFKLDSK